MGNAIFVAAYLIMMPLTLTRIVSTFRSILTDEQSGAGDVLRAAVYIFILLAQLITIYFSQSRGPLLGLLGGLGIWALLGSLLLQRASRGDGATTGLHLPGAWGRAASFGMVGVTAAALFAGAILLRGSSLAASLALSAAGVLMAATAAWGILAANARKGFFARTRPMAALVDDLGKAMGFLILTVVASGLAAAVLYFSTSALLTWMVRSGPLLAAYVAAGGAVLLIAGAWLAGRGKTLGWWLAGIGGLSVILVAVVFLARGQSAPAQLIAVGGGILALLATWLLFIVNRWGWRWLWMSVVTMAVAAGGLFLAINPGGPLHEVALQQQAIRRYAGILSSESGTARVRSLIWEGALEMVLPHDPINYPPTSDYPRGRADSLNWLRPLVGYGPESMYVAYNRFYPPLLGHYESRTASPDRSHNETMDSLVITGLLGLAAYVWLFGGIIYYGAKWLGLLGSRRRRLLLVCLLALGVVALLAMVLASIGAYFVGLTIPVGLVLGLLIFLAAAGVSAYWEKAPTDGLHPHSLLLVGILATVVAHLVEINFGIAIASTRTTFWALAGLLVVSGLGLSGDLLPPSEEEELQSELGGQPKSRVRSRRRSRGKRRRGSSPASRGPSPTLAWLGPVLAVSVVGGFITATLGFDFVTNAERLSDPVRIVSRALTILPAQGSRRSYGALLVFAITWLMSAVLLVPDVGKREGSGRRQVQALAYGVYLLVSLAIGYGFALSLAARQVSFLTSPTTIEALIALSDRIASLLTMYYGLIIFTLLAGAAGLIVGLRLPGQVSHPWGWMAVIVLGVAAGAIIIPYNLRPIQADIVYKQADPYDRQGQWRVSVEQYGHALDLAPREDFYHLYLGRSLLEYATSIQDAGARDQAMRETESVLIQARETNPLNTDHSANLARMYRRWGGLTSDEATRQTLLEQSVRNYEIATSLSPNNALLWNEWSLLNYYDIGSVEDYEQAHARSLEIDPEYEQTWLICGDVSRTRGELEEAVECYTAALELKPDNAQVWRVLADTFITLQQWPDAIDALSRVIELQSGEATADMWSLHHVLSQLYSQVGDRERALQEAYIAVQLAPQDQITVVQSWLAQLQGAGGTEE
jgi:tetratricopeptide (TPR) repeat protein